VEAVAAADPEGWVARVEMEEQQAIRETPATLETMEIMVMAERVVMAE
jgi:hypothetical protein